MSEELRNTPVYAGFWRRVAAVTIDGCLLLALLVALSRSVGAPGLLLRDEWLPNLLSALVSLAYSALFESSAWQATPGKRLLRIKVTDLQGARISWRRAVLRRVAQVLSAVCLMLGYLMAAFTRRRQCLHDLIAGTLVVRGSLTAEQVAQAPDAPRWSRWAVAALVAPLIAGWLALLSLQLDHGTVTASPLDHYLARTEVAAALYYAGDAMDQAEGLYAESHDFAQVNITDIELDDDASRTISALRVVAGSIHVTFGGDAESGLHAHTLTLTPALDSDGNIAWVCGLADVPDGYQVLHDDYRSLTDIDQSLLPADCLPQDEAEKPATRTPGLKV